MSQYQMPRGNVPKTAELKFKVGDRVAHVFGVYPDGHGPGEVIRLNENREGLYRADKYPYVVLFDNGYLDFYMEKDLKGEVG